jgi:hypothetical protein
VGGRVSPQFELAVFDFYRKIGSKCLINVNYENLVPFQTCRTAFTALRYLKPFSRKRISKMATDSKIGDFSAREAKYGSNGWSERKVMCQRIVGDSLFFQNLFSE